MMKNNNVWIAMTHNLQMETIDAYYNVEKDIILMENCVLKILKIKIVIILYITVQNMV